jgi:hypothetical protein
MIAACLKFSESAHAREPDRAPQWPENRCGSLCAIFAILCAMNGEEDFNQRFGLVFFLGAGAHFLVFAARSK